MIKLWQEIKTLTWRSWFFLTLPSRSGLAVIFHRIPVGWEEQRRRVCPVNPACWFLLFWSFELSGHLLPVSLVLHLVQADCPLCALWCSPVLQADFFAVLHFLQYWKLLTMSLSLPCLYWLRRLSFISLDLCQKLQRKACFWWCSAGLLHYSRKSLIKVSWNCLLITWITVKKECF